MSTIFPGMDPYLEDPQLWPGVHSRLIVYIADELQPHIRPRYIAAVEERVFVEGPTDRSIVPDVWLRRERLGPNQSAAAVLDADTAVTVQALSLDIHETYIEILDQQSGQRVVTVLEVVSPTNKYVGPGRTSYLAKQREVLASNSHLVEIDLLRQGPHALAVPEYLARRWGMYDYLVCINRAADPRDKFELYPRRVRDRLPRIRVPLAGSDPDVRLDLQAVFARTYEAGSYRDRLHYGEPCHPPLGMEDQAWASELLRAAPPPAE